MHRLPLLGTAVALVALCSVLFGFTAAAGAAPTVGFDVPGDADQTLTAIKSGNAGSVWVQQKTDGSHFRLRRFAADGTLAASSDEIAGATADSFAPAPDGSAWVASKVASAVSHVAANGDTTTFNLPSDALLTYGGAIAADSDSNAWVVTCPPAVSWEIVPCDATKITPSGAMSSVNLPGFDAPNNMLIGHKIELQIFPVDDGLWFASDDWVHEFGDSHSAVAFVSNAGAVTPVNLGLNTRLVAPGPSGKAWWMRWSKPATDNDVRTMTVGQATKDANVLPVSDPIEGDFYNTPPTLASDPAGNLLFAFNHTPTDGWVGDFTDGAARVTGVPALKNVIVPARDCEGFSAHSACGYIDTIRRTADGAIWLLADPDTLQVGRLAADGTWSHFSPLTGVSEGLTAKGMTQSTDGAIWFALEQADGTHTISRADPTAPPADETPAPPPPPTGSTGSTGPSDSGSSGSSVTSKSTPDPAASQDELDAIAETVRDGIGAWRSKKFSPKIAIPFPRYGRLDITIKSGKTVLAKIAKSRATGPHVMKLKVGTAGRMLLKRRPTRASLSAQIKVVFSTAGRKQASYTLHIRL